jgi:hypothetical protein
MNNLHFLWLYLQEAYPVVPLHSKQYWLRRKVRLKHKVIVTVKLVSTKVIP